MSSGRSYSPRESGVSQDARFADQTETNSDMGLTRHTPVVFEREQLHSPQFSSEPFKSNFAAAPSPSSSPMSTLVPSGSDYEGLYDASPRRLRSPLSSSILRPDPDGSEYQGLYDFSPGPTRQENQLNYSHQDDAITALASNVDNMALISLPESFTQAGLIFGMHPVDIRRSFH